MAYDLQKLTPNLIVSDVQRSIDFYRDVLEFTVTQTVPDTARSSSQSCSAAAWKCF